MSTPNWLMNSNRNARGNSRVARSVIMHVPVFSPSRRKNTLSRVGAMHPEGLAVRHGGRDGGRDDLVFLPVQEA
ncbi:hypothetical protein GCM10010359_01620 [Streptomyces morookaense]|nr:hypothetical protein GCM10010359_01620 [Streptomyces morookaense]